MIWRALLLVVGVYCCSTAVIMIKACEVHPVLLASYRQLLAALALSPLLLRDLRRHLVRGAAGDARGATALAAAATGSAPPTAAFRPRMLLRTVLPGAVLGAHFVTWIIGARLTPAANSSLIVNMVPIAMPFLAYALLRERLTRGELTGTAVAIGGLVLLGWADFRLSAVHFQGDLLCFGSMLLFALYLALGRRNRAFPSLWLYVVPLYFVGGVVCFVAALPQVSPLAIPSAWDGLMVLGLALVPTVMGHSILNASMKHLSGQTVSLANLGQFVFAGVMGYAWLDEGLAWSFYPAAALVVLGAVVALRSAPRPVPARPAGGAVRRTRGATNDTNDSHSAV